MTNLHYRQNITTFIGYRHIWRVVFWINIIIWSATIILVLRSILLPFVVGAAVAYFLDPIVDRLEQIGCSRTFSTLIIIVVFSLVLIVIGVVCIPILVDQVRYLTSHTPSYYDLLVQRLEPVLRQFITHLDHIWQKHLTEAVTSFAKNAVSWVGLFAAQVWSSSMALLWLSSLIVITPLVTFYLLRDWDQMMIQIDSLLPRQYYNTIRYLVNEIDYAMARLARGQAIVCLILGIFYAVSLTVVVGLDVGLIIGSIVGLISFIPYTGVVLGLMISISLSIVKFGTWQSVALTLVVFGTGQILEGNILTPKLVGERIGLHPVWIVFSLLSCGTLLGFTGVLLAVPIAAIFGVFIRFSLRHYLLSPLYYSK